MAQEVTEARNSNSMTSLTIRLASRIRWVIERSTDIGYFRFDRLGNGPGFQGGRINAGYLDRGAYQGVFECLFAGDCLFENQAGATLLGYARTDPQRVIEVRGLAVIDV